MSSGSAETTEKTGGPPRVTQFSIFLPNKVGALLEVVRMLNERGIDVLALSVQDSADTAIVRIVVSDPESVEDLFLENAVPASICDLVVVELKEGASELGKLLQALLAAECNIFGSYALMTRPRGKCALALHAEDNDVAVAVLKQHGFTILAQSDISR
jgi:hypothetical protein